MEHSKEMAVFYRLAIPYFTIVDKCSINQVCRETRNVMYTEEKEHHCRLVSLIRESLKNGLTCRAAMISIVHGDEVILSHCIAKGAVNYLDLSIEAIRGSRDTITLGLIDRLIQRNHMVSECLHIVYTAALVHNRETIVDRILNSTDFIKVSDPSSYGVCMLMAGVATGKLEMLNSVEPFKHERELRQLLIELSKSKYAPFVTAIIDEWQITDSGQSPMYEFLSGRCSFESVLEYCLDTIPGDSTQCESLYHSLLANDTVEIEKYANCANTVALALLYTNSRLSLFPPLLHLLNPSILYYAATSGHSDAFEYLIDWFKGRCGEPLYNHTKEVSTDLTLNCLSVEYGIKMDALLKGSGITEHRNVDACYIMGYTTMFFLPCLYSQIGDVATGKYDTGRREWML